jgi:CubicO group peptidase (beta-lactamase class C family)
MKKIFYTLSALVISLNVLAQPAFVKDSLDAFIMREMQRWQVPGLAIAIVKDGQVVVQKGYGVKQFDKPESKVDENTLFQIASNSKAFTGTAVAWLNSEKRISLDEKVTTYLPYFKLYESSSTDLCTVRDLLCHRLGTQTFQGDFLNWGSNLTRKQIVEGLSRTKPIHPFRYKYGYSNAGFIAAGEVILATTDTTWDDFLLHRFFKPMGMKRTTTSYADMVNDNNACLPHTLVDGKLVKMPLTNIDNMGASASINSCVGDMKNWLLLQLNNGQLNGKQIIPADVIAETRKSNMIVNDVNSKFFRSKHFSTYTLGWQMNDYNGRRVIEHSGGANGFVTKTELVPEENLGVIVYTNTDANSLYDALCKQVLEAYMGMPYRNVSEMYYTNSQKAKEATATKIKAIKDTIALKNEPALKLNEYCGTFINSLYGKVEVKLVKGKLQLFMEHHPNNVGKLDFINDNRFLCTYTDLTCGVEPLSFTIENHQVKYLTVKVADFIDYLSYEFVKE